MDKEFIPYEQALALKECGFDEPCFGYWFVNLKGENMLTYPQTKFTKWYTGKEILAPLYQQAFRWFREKYDLYFYIQYHKILHYYYVYINDKMLILNINGKRCPEFMSYEEAELACLIKLIEITKTK